MVADPTGYGRVIRDERARSSRSASNAISTNDDQRAIREINPGIYVAEDRAFSAKRSRRSSRTTRRASST